MLVKYCNKTGCNKLIPMQDHYCDRHINEANNRHKEYDNSRRNQKFTAFYKSIQWTHMQKHIIRRYKGLDIYDYYINDKITQATTVHHIHELSECWERRLDVTNLIPLSSVNHGIITQIYKKDKNGMQKQLAELIVRYQKEFSIDTF